MAEELKNNTEEMVQEPENRNLNEEASGTEAGKPVGAEETKQEEAASSQAQQGAQAQEDGASQNKAQAQEERADQGEAQGQEQSQTRGTADSQSTARTKSAADSQGTARTQHRWRGGRLRFGEEEDLFFRDEEIISKLEGEDLLKYLSMEQKKEEMRQNAREVRERRIFSGFQLTVSLAAVVAIVGFLKDDPTVLVNILYIIGIITVLWILKRKDK